MKALLATILLLSVSALAGETDVTLFGQKCKMSGPLDAPMLEKINSVGPEQIYAPTSYRDSVTKLKESLAKITKASGLPAEFDLYKERQTKRLTALQAYLESYEAARIAKKAAPLVNGVKKHLPEKAFKPFETGAANLEAKKFASSELSDQLFTQYVERIEPDPAQDFHRAIQKIGVKYQCAYDEGSDVEEEE